MKPRIESKHGEYSMNYKWNIPKGFLTKKQEARPIYPSKLEISDWIFRLNTARRKQKDKEKKRKLSIMIDEFKTLKDSL